MPKIRVLLVDDSAIVRRIVGSWISGEPDVDLAGTAGDGRQALEKVETLAPDVLVMDIEMPVMDGLSALRELRARHPRLPVIMFSTLTERGCIATLEALACGASDYLTKPSAGELERSGPAVREALLAKVRALAGPRKAAAAPASAAGPTPPRALPRAPRTPSVQVVAIGCSTGGPSALERVLPELPEAFPVPVVIVQHMPANFTALLAKRLDEKSRITVREAAHGMPLVAGEAYVAPGGFHMVVRRARGETWLETNQDAPENSCRPAVDVLFRSVAETYAGNTLAVVMTGMGQDGLRGVERLASLGARTIAQDEATSVVWGMPGFVARAGLADHVLPLESIGAEIVRQTSFCSLPRARAKP